MGENIVNVNGNSICMNNTEVTINGKTYKKPGVGNAISTINGVIYINNYVFKDGKFKFSLWAIWYNWL